MGRCQESIPRKREDPPRLGFGMAKGGEREKKMTGKDEGLVAASKDFGGGKK